jgi:hypothetical protein
VVEHVEDRRRDRSDAAEGHAHDHVADLADDVEADDALHVRLGDGTEHADHHREPGDHQQQFAVGLGEQQRLSADDRVHADLGQQPGEHRAHGARCRRITVRQPGEQREHRRLEAERDQQQQVEAELDAVGQLGEPLGQHRHVQGAGCREDQRDAGDQHERLDDVQHDIGRPGTDLAVIALECQQHVAGDQQDLEPHEQVEEVAGEECAAHTGDQHE